MNILFKFSGAAYRFEILGDKDARGIVTTCTVII